MIRAHGSLLFNLFTLEWVFSQAKTMMHRLFCFRLNCRNLEKKRRHRAFEMFCSTFDMRACSLKDFSLRRR